MDETFTAEPWTLVERALQYLREHSTDRIYAEQVAAAAGVELGDDRVVVGPVSPEGGAAAFERAWEDGLRPTGVLVMSDAMALGVLHAARRIGLAVPAEQEDEVEKFKEFLDEISPEDFA